MAVKCFSLVVVANTASAASNNYHTDLGSPAQTVVSLNTNLSIPETHHPIKRVCISCGARFPVMPDQSRAMRSRSRGASHCGAVPVVSTIASMTFELENYVVRFVTWRPCVRAMPRSHHIRCRLWLPTNGRLRSGRAGHSRNPLQHPCVTVFWGSEVRMALNLLPFHTA
jgi:hypothetical protein